ncbi:molybdopterin-dependent oxidoreductase [Acidihalobacter prosperus]|uniref:Oxidoreductase molybdopterin-binding domain-containing protein n=1 Tax=Acidihalobacter prosperus TaxID=160660 RepID=A0A1A6C6M3_9GAMM|nr:molybdopterin-dependent oxidoreductase [Acidihalobacter prosperus]OBS10195.1 hypothetical protein Thpro_021245 [Acidihalobacter prosperus]
MSVPSPVYLWGLVPLGLLGIGLLAHKSLAVRWPALGDWLRRRTWPWTLRIVHVFLLASFIVLMLSGVAIYLPDLHAVLLPWLQTIYALHVWLGTAFLVALLIALLSSPRLVRRVRLVDWTLVSAGSLFLGVSGYVLWFDTTFPVYWNAIAFGWHGWVAYALLAWLLVHGFLRTFSFQRSGHPLNWRVDFTRRRFLSMGVSLVGASFGLLGLAGMRRRPDPTSGGVDSMATSDAAAQWAFPEHYSYTGIYPEIDPVGFRLSIGGLVEHPVTMRLEEIRALDPVMIRSNFHCVTGWSVPDVPWDGIAVEALMAHAGVLPQARYLAFYSADGVYVDCLSLQQARVRGVMLAYGIAGEPLPGRGGFPLRLVVPGMYGYKSVKWVDRVVATAEPVTGTWERQGYPADAYLGSVKTGF